MPDRNLIGWGACHDVGRLVDAEAVLVPIGMGIEPDRCECQIRLLAGNVAHPGADRIPFDAAQGQRGVSACAPAEATTVWLISSARMQRESRFSSVECLIAGQHEQKAGRVANKERSRHHFINELKIKNIIRGSGVKYQRKK